MDINEIIRQVTEEICSKYGAQTQTPAASDGYTPADMAKYIDHTYLKPASTRSARSATRPRSITAPACA